MHGLRHPLLQQRLPARQPHPRLERPRLPGPLEGRHRAPPRHQQLPRVHRPAVPGALRGGLRARDQPGSRHHQAGRGRDHRPGVGRGLGHPDPPQGPDRQAGGRRGVGSGRVGRRPAAHPGRSRRRRAGAGRPDRRVAALRHPRVQDGEAPRRPAHRPDGGRGHGVHHVGRGRRGRHRRGAASRLRRRGAGRRGHPVARPSHPGPGPRRGPPGHGVPAGRQPGAAGRRARAVDHRRRQAGRDHRRRRHRRRLPGDGAPPGGGVGPPVRDHAATARPPPTSPRGRPGR